MIRLVDIMIKETPEGLMRILRSKLKGWPDYVIKDMVIGGKKISSEKDLKKRLERLEDLDYQVKGETWKLHRQMELRYDMLHKRTQDFMERREFGLKNVFNIERDKERSKEAYRIIKEKGIENLPPIIMFRGRGGKLELIEGWHRVMAAFNLYPEGFKVNAWIADEKVAI